MAITYLSSVANILSTNAWAMTDEEANLVRDISCIYKKSKCKLTYTDYPHEDTPKEIKECLIELSDTPSGIQLIVEYKNKSDEAKVFTGEKISISNNNKITSSCKETLKRKNRRLSK